MLQGLRTVLRSALFGDISSTLDQVRPVVGYYNIAGRRDPRTRQRTFYACVAESFSAHEMRLTVPVIGDVGESITVQFDQFGELRGSIANVMDRGFHFDIQATDDERARLAAKIIWYEKSLRDEVCDVRFHGRRVPREPLSSLILADGQTIRCLVIDMSRSGVAVSAGVVPEIGTPLAVGKLVGRVIRHFKGGFAIHFVDQQELDDLERLLIKPLAEPSPIRKLLRAVDNVEPLSWPRQRTR
jgi:hypothetical protein